MAAVVETFTPAKGSTGVNSLTCISCRMSFPTSKDQRLHYQTEIHRFNLKRKVAELPPVTQEVYEQKLAQDALNTSTNDKTKMKEQNIDIVCTVCNKKFASPNTLTNHTQSKKHLDKVAAAARKDDPKDEKTPKKKQAKPIPIYLKKEDCVKRVSMEVENDNEEGVTEMTEADQEKAIDKRIENSRKILPEECMFCLKDNKDLESNAKHMALVHSFFIPDIDYLTDMSGLFKYLGEKISIGLTCVWCDQMFSSLDAVLHHMIDKSHCKLNYENEAEYEDFYDFSSDYNGDEEEISKKKKPIEISENGLELTLPDGRVIGHRSMSRYYQQNIRVETRESALIASVSGQYRMLGYNSDWEKKHSGRSQLQTVDLKKQRRYEHSIGLIGNNQRYWRDPTKGF